jgi:hypothetical protein
MATDLTPAKAAPPARHDAFVADRLATTQRRIRTLDLTAGLCGLLALALGYAAALLAADSFFDLPAAVRLVAWVVLLVGAAIWLAAFVVRPLLLPINPYYAARRLEGALPAARNSVVNWLDLRREDLPPAIRAAVGRRAAKDLEGADPDRAVGGRRAFAAGVAAAVATLLFLAAVIVVIIRGDFGSHFVRAFAPFDGGAAPAARLVVLRPEEGDAVVTGDEAVEFLVRVDGRAPDPKGPDAPRLLVRYQPGAPYTARPLDPAAGGRWATTLAAPDVHEGFWYKVQGAGAETAEYRVRLTPRVTHFQASYHFPRSPARPDLIRPDARDVKAVRGAEVEVRVLTNREVADGRLEFTDNKGAATIWHGIAMKDDPQGFTVRRPLTESGQYRVAFTSAEGENYAEPRTSPLTAVVPTAELTRPGQDMKLPADGILHLEGLAADEYGVAAVRLRLRVENGPELAPQEYRKSEELRLPGGGRPTRVEYRDFVELAKVKNPKDERFRPAENMVLVYWLEAEDACAAPGPNVGESRQFRVTLTKPADDPKTQEKERIKAEKEKKAHEAKQDEQFKQEGKGGKNDGGKGGADSGEGDKPKESDDGKKSGDGGAAQDKKDGQTRNDAQQLQTGTDKSPANGKGDPKDQPPGEGKDGGAKQEPPQPGAAKENPSADGKNDAAQDKDGGPAGDKPEQSSGKGGQPDQKQPPGEGKGGDPKGSPDAAPGAAKDGKSEPPQPASDKDGGAKDAQPSAGEGKSDPGRQPDKADKSEAKNGGGEGKAGEAKDKPAPGDRAETKGADPKDGPSAAKGAGDGKPGEGKSGGANGGDVTKADTKPDPDAGKPNPRDATPRDVNELAKDLNGDDANKREDAARQLATIWQHAENPETKEAAEKAINDAIGKHVADAKGGDPSDRKTEPGESKSGTGGDNPGEGKAAGPGGDDAAKGGAKDGGGSPEAGKPKDGWDVANGKPPLDMLLPEKQRTPQRSGKPGEQKATVLQLESFRQKVNKGVLDRIGWTDEQYREFLEDYRDLARRDAAADRDLPAQNGGPLGSAGGKTTTGVPKDATDANAEDRGVPPPGFRGPYEKFTKLAGQKDADDK